MGTLIHLPTAHTARLTHTFRGHTSLAEWLRQRSLPEIDSALASAQENLEAEREYLITLSLELEHLQDRYTETANHVLRLAHEIEVLEAAQWKD